MRTVSKVGDSRFESWLPRSLITEAGYPKDIRMVIYELTERGRDLLAAVASRVGSR